MRCLEWLTDKLVDVKWSTKEVTNPEKRAEYAKELIENPLWMETIRNVKFRLYMDFKDTAWIDKATREQIYRTAKAVDYINGYLNRVVGEAIQYRINKMTKEASYDG